MLSRNSRLAPWIIFKVTSRLARGRIESIMRGFLFQGSRCDWNESAAPSLVVFKCGAAQHTVVVKMTAVCYWVGSKNNYPPEGSFWRSVPVPILATRSSSCAGLPLSPGATVCWWPVVSARSIACWAPFKWEVNSGCKSEFLSWLRCFVHVVKLKGRITPHVNFFQQAAKER